VACAEAVVGDEAMPALADEGGLRLESEKLRVHVVVLRQAPPPPPPHVAAWRAISLTVPPSSIAAAEWSGLFAEKGFEIYHLVEVLA
jgi:hypothetical protein